MLSPDTHQMTCESFQCFDIDLKIDLTALEEYLSRSLALCLFALSVMSLFLSGAFPISQLPSEATKETSENPYAIPTLVVTTFYHGSTAVYTYMRYNRNGQAMYVLASITSASLAAMGLWVAMFGNDSHVSKRTGADKRTSGWPFGNRVADEKKAGRKRL